MNQKENKPVIVMIGDYPYETTLKDAPKVMGMAKKAAEYLLNNGIPKEKVDHLYSTRLVEHPEQN